MFKRSTTFTRGSGVYQCRNCQRRTRDDGNGDSVHVRLCTQCFDLGGLENHVADHGETPEVLEEIAALQAAILKRGGKL